jgi:hypothetical protein
MKAQPGVAEHGPAKYDDHQQQRRQGKQQRHASGPCCFEQHVAFGLNPVHCGG